MADPVEILANKLESDFVNQLARKCREKYTGEDFHTAFDAGVLYALFMDKLGLSLEDEHTMDTPFRHVKHMMDFIAKGKEEVQFTTFPMKESAFYSGPVIVRDINFYSMCAHHHLPFFGKAHVMYIPDKSLVGLSKIPRIVQKVASKPSTQELVTDEIALELAMRLDPEYGNKSTKQRSKVQVGVQIEAQHLCMCMRGVKDPNSTTITRTTYGAIDFGAFWTEFNQLMKT